MSNINDTGSINGTNNIHGTDNTENTVKTGLVLEGGNAWDVYRRYSGCLSGSGTFL